MVQLGNANRRMAVASELEQLKFTKNKNSRTHGTTSNLSKTLKTPKTPKKEWTKKIKETYNGKTPIKSFY